MSQNKFVKMGLNYIITSITRGQGQRSHALFLKRTQIQYNGVGKKNNKKTDYKKYEKSTSTSYCATFRCFRSINFWTSLLAKLPNSPTLLPILIFFFSKLINCDASNEENYTLINDVANYPQLLYNLNIFQYGSRCVASLSNSTFVQVFFDWLAIMNENTTQKHLIRDRFSDDRFSGSRYQRKLKIKEQEMGD